MFHFLFTSIGKYKHQIENLHYSYNFLLITTKIKYSNYV